MSQTLTEYRQMAGRKKENFDRGRVEFKAPPEWIRRATHEAELLGLNLSSYMRMVVTERMDKTESERGPKKKR